MADKQLLSPFKIKNTTFRNRIVVSPMCQYSSTDGFATDWHLVHLGSRATGGAGLIMQEATAVSPEGRITHADLGIWKDEHIDKLRQVVTFLQEQGAKAGIQLAHAGRKASCEPPWSGGAQVPANEALGWTTLSAGALPFKADQEAPVALTETGIKQVVDDFVRATRRAKAVGYDVVEIHAAHGYLLHQFYSPLSNHRTDAYGGSFDNRIRIVLEIAEAVKREWGAEQPLFVRISATDWTDGGWTIEDSIRLARELKALGVDLIDTSSGGNVPTAKIPAKPGYQVRFAERIRKEADIATGAVGLITTPEQAEQILQAGQADLVFLARESLRNPNFPFYAAHVLGEEIAWPKQYTRGESGMRPRR